MILIHCDSFILTCMYSLFYQACMTALSAWSFQVTGGIVSWLRLNLRLPDESCASFSSTLRAVDRPVQRREQRRDQPFEPLIDWSGDGNNGVINRPSRWSTGLAMGTTTLRTVDRLVWRWEQRCDQPFEPLIDWSGDGNNGVINRPSRWSTGLATRTTAWSTLRTVDRLVWWWEQRRNQPSQPLIDWSGGIMVWSTLQTVDLPDEPWEQS